MTRQDEPHPFQPIPEMPIVFPKTGPLMTPMQNSGVVGRIQSTVCEICGRPEQDKLHTSAEDAGSSATARWGL